MPALQVPALSYTRSDEPTHVVAGGELHITVAHGSPLQMPLVHPNMQLWSTGEYEQLPAPEHAPGVAQVRAVLPMQVGAGGELQTESENP